MKAPMSAIEAKRVLSAMKAQTKNKTSRVIVLELALGPHGNLSPEAKALYEAALLEEVRS